MRCNSCDQDKPEEAFYASNRSKCKECVKAAARANRIANIEHYRSFDRMRASQPHRVKARLAYAETDAFRESHRKATRKYIAEHPERRKAQVAVSNAVRDGRLVKQPCMVCGAKAEAHHPDYDRVLDVVWLCPKHHDDAHAIAANDERKEAAA